jgi:large subunit ribosomal protein L37e
MTKGTTSMGKRTKKTHIICRRCGKRSYHIRKKRCAHCGFGDTAKMRNTMKVNS